MQPVTNKVTLTPNLLNIPNRCRFSIIEFLSPKDCAQSLFRVCKALRSTAFNWENLKVVVFSDTETPNKGKWQFCQLLSANGQDFGLKFQDFGYYAISRNEHITPLPMHEKFGFAGFALNKFCFSNSLEDQNNLKTFQPADQGLVEREPLLFSSKDKKSISKISELPKNQSAVSKIYLERNHEFGFRICDYQDGWREKFHKYFEGCLDYKQLGQILFISDDKGNHFFDLTDENKPISISQTIINKFLQGTHSQTQFLFRYDYKSLIAIEMNEENGKKEMVQKWISYCNLPSPCRIEDNEHLILIIALDGSARTFVLDARTGCMLFMP